MSIFVSEPGRPVGTRLPEALRSRRVGTVTELSESAPIDVEHSEATDGEFQQAAHSGAGYHALQEYGAAASAQPLEERVYLPVSDICSPAHYTVAASASIAEALDTMDTHGVHHLVVLADANVAGLIDFRWLLSWVHEQGSEAMNQSLIHMELPAFLTASPETDAHQLARLMLAHSLSAALVIDAAGQPSGVVTSTDYLKLYASAGKQQGAV
ncbi:CBS domain-containing protein [Marinobacter sp. VGCF2001]|uniref:CBS domain-containing protein n=1 Tax=Marinobacter sp. VGCF2001 TaxID=3417189 RepID=UPI003CF23182